jgi:hypothetical protein
MSDRENFLERWSRRKSQAQREPAEDSAAPDAPKRDLGITKPPEHAPERGARTGESAKPQSPEIPKPEFDLSSLPPLESITGASDVRAYLAPGVPAELTRAALRRAWVADPAIRDFVGLAENAWNFTDPAAVPGFGDIPAGYDIKKMVAQVFGETGATAEEPASSQTGRSDAAASQHLEAAGDSSPSAEAEAEPHPPDEPAGNAATAEEIPSRPPADFVQRDIDAALQTNLAEVPPKDRRRRRQHGGALPRPGS